MGPETLHYQCSEMNVYRCKNSIFESIMMVYDGCHLIIGEFLMINVEVEGSKGYKSPISWKIKLYDSMN